jgi:hypothetical protein
MVPQTHPETGAPILGDPQPSVAVDPLLDNHQVEFETIENWANSDQGRQAKKENPMGFLNVRCHALQHYQQMNQGGANKPPSESINFKDLPPDGQVQMAQQAGIKLDPALLAAKQEQDKAAAAAKAKAAPGGGK